jgi:hypothetical protein
MKSRMNTISLFASIALLSLGFSAARAQNAPNAPESMRFFVTSAGSGKGGDLGGLTGADAHCQSLPTGIETDIDTFIALPEALSLTRCPACGGNHYWTKSQTWICNIEPSSRALLPAEVVGGH